MFSYDWNLYWYFNAGEVEISAAALKHIFCPVWSISFTLKWFKTLQEFSHPRSCSPNRLNIIIDIICHRALVHAASYWANRGSRWATSLRGAWPRPDSHIQYLLCCHFLIRSDFISIYCILVFQRPQAQWALCVCVPVPVGEPWNVFCLRLYCDNIFPSESQAALCSGATFPLPTNRTLSVSWLHHQLPH